MLQYAGDAEPAADASDACGSRAPSHALCPFTLIRRKAPGREIERRERVSCLLLIDKRPNIARLWSTVNMETMLGLASNL